MADDKSKRGKPDQDRIAFEQRDERILACHRFRCTETELLLAIMLIGPMRADVLATLQTARAEVERLNVSEKKRAAARKRRTRR